MGPKSSRARVDSRRFTKIASDPALLGKPAKKLSREERDVIDQELLCSGFRRRLNHVATATTDVPRPRRMHSASHTALDFAGCEVQGVVAVDQQRTQSRHAPVAKMT